MKNHILTVSIALILVVALGFTSCNKDGVYNPKKKISKIYHEYSGQTKQLYQTWTWDKNKLQKIDFGYNNYQIFEYDKKQVSKIINSNGSYMTLTYDGSKIKEILRYTKDNKILEKYSFEHDGSQVNKILVEENHESSYSSKLLQDYELDALCFILPENAARSIINDFKSKKKNQKSTEVIKMTLEFTWGKRNIEQMVTTYIKEDETSSKTIIYEYDKEKNPFDGLLYTDMLYSSKNNIIKEKITHTNNNTEEFNYSYVYDGDFPTQAICTYEDGTTFTAYYEYVKD